MQPFHGAGHAHPLFHLPPPPPPPPPGLPPPHQRPGTVRGRGLHHDGFRERGWVGPGESGDHHHPRPSQSHPAFEQRQGAGDHGASATSGSSRGDALGFGHGHHRPDGRLDEPPHAPRRDDQEPSGSGHGHDHDAFQPAVAGGSLSLDHPDHRDHRDHPAGPASGDRMQGHKSRDWERDGDLGWHEPVGRSDNREPQGQRPRPTQDVVVPFSPSDGGRDAKGFPTPTSGFSGSSSGGDEQPVAVMPLAPTASSVVCGTSTCSEAVAELARAQVALTQVEVRPSVLKNCTHPPNPPPPAQTHWLPHPSCFPCCDHSHCCAFMSSHSVLWCVVVCRCPVAGQGRGS